MSETPQNDNSTQSLQAAIDAARDAGETAGRTAGYASGRADASAIMGSEEAAGRSALAAELAGDPAISVERAESLLAKGAKEKDGTFAELMQGNSPNVGPSDDKETAERNERVEFLQNIGKTVSGT